jgi:putative nucleotidyltransferase with HDIG domain
LAPVVLLHHASARYLASVPPYYRDLAQLLHIADRLEISSRHDGNTPNDILQSLLTDGAARFSPEHLRLFVEREGAAGSEELWQYLCRMQQNRSDLMEYLKMVVLSIDFKSRITVTHTIATAELSRLAASLFHCSPEDTEYITTGALLHDLGKVAIPVEILENPGRLNAEDMEIMRRHAVFTGQILRDRVDERLERIAFRHHEKLDGSGYPLGLRGEDLTFEEKLVAITDILSALCGARSYKDPFPKDKALSILSEMAGSGLLDAVITQKIIDNYDFLLKETEKATLPVTANYDNLLTEYQHMREHITAMQEKNDFQFDSYF